MISSGAVVRAAVDQRAPPARRRSVAPGSPRRCARRDASSLRTGTSTLAAMSRSVIAMLSRLRPDPWRPGWGALVSRPMCGIAGKVTPEGEVDDRLARAHVRGDRAIAGPTREGLHRRRASGSGSSGCAIIDLETGDQPIANEDGTRRRRLQRRDLQLPRAAGRARAGGAPVPHPQRHRGDRPPLRGPAATTASTACAACSPSRSGTARRRRLLLARDRLGKKPLFYSHRDGTLWFGSEAQGDPPGSRGPARRRLRRRRRLPALRLRARPARAPSRRCASCPRRTA